MSEKHEMTLNFTIGAKKNSLRVFSLSSLISTTTSILSHLTLTLEIIFSPQQSVLATTWRCSKPFWRKIVDCGVSLSGRQTLTP